MATTVTTTYYVMAEFKTAYLQREVVVQKPVASAVKVGQVCEINSSGQIAPISSTTSADAAKALATAGTMIIAQSDMTVSKGHIPVENRDHNYSDVVASDTNNKHVMVFMITDPSDLKLSTFSVTTE